MYVKSFVKGRRKAVETRDRHGMGKHDMMSVTHVTRDGADLREVDMVRGGVTPSRKAMAVFGSFGRSTDKLYASKVYVDGMNKRPRRALTLGNKLDRQRGTVERLNLTDDRKAVSSRVSEQRVRQVDRALWDVLDREVMVVYMGYIKKEYRKRPLDKKECEVYRETMEVYIDVRRCEVYRNLYEVLGRYDHPVRGRYRKASRLEAKYSTKSKRPLPKALKIERQGRYPALKTEWYRREGERMSHLRVTVKKEFNEAYESREERTRVNPGRLRIDHVKALVERSRQTRTNRLLQTHRVPRLPVPMDDIDRGILMEAPTTQYFAKRSNLVRRMERLAIPKQLALKRAKVPETQRAERYPYSRELDHWTTRLMQAVQDETITRRSRGETGYTSAATYRQLSKKVIHLYREMREGRIARWPSVSRVVMYHHSLHEGMDEMDERDFEVKPRAELN
jgi:hypothetical protein